MGERARDIFHHLFWVDNKHWVPGHVTPHSLKRSKKNTVLEGGCLLALPACRGWWLVHSRQGGQWPPHITGIRQSRACHQGLPEMGWGRAVLLALLFLKRAALLLLLGFASFNHRVRDPEEGSTNLACPGSALRDRECPPVVWRGLHTLFCPLS